MNKKDFMRTLEAHNKNVLRAHEENNIIKGNGIACPSCGGELYDSDPGVILTSYPPQHRVACTECDYRGTRY